MLGEHTVKVQDKLEVELKKFLEAVFDKTEKVSTDKISFETGEFVCFGHRAKCNINDINHVACGDNSLKYQIKIYHPVKIDPNEWTESDREDLFFMINFTGKDEGRYYIVVNSADTKHFANYEVMIYLNINRKGHYQDSRIAAYTLSALNELEEYKFVDKLMERTKNLVSRHTHTKNNVSNDKQEFLSIISDVINTGN
nr:MAG TPA: hypothetical protein [Caudoviricetes sp.]